MIPSFVEVTGEKLVGGLFAPTLILNRVKERSWVFQFFYSRQYGILHYIMGKEKKKISITIKINWSKIHFYNLASLTYLYK